MSPALDPFLKHSWQLNFDIVNSATVTARDRVKVALFAELFFHKSPNRIMVNVSIE